MWDSKLQPQDQKSHVVPTEQARCHQISVTFLKFVIYPIFYILENQNNYNVSSSIKIKADLVSVNIKYIFVH